MERINRKFSEDMFSPCYKYSGGGTFKTGRRISLVFIILYRIKNIRNFLQFRYIYHTPHCRADK